jgi:type I restriction enzyme M protein
MIGEHPSDAAGRLVRKLWQYCNILRDDGLSYPDYVEQLTYLLFLKMSAEQSESPLPPQYAWHSFLDKNATAMHAHYAKVLAALSKEKGLLGLIFRDAKNKIQDPAKLRLLIVDLIGQTEWTGLSADVKGDAYEGLLEKNARDTKSGAGQYFTPRPLIEAIVACVDPEPGEIVSDPACGTGGFLLAANRHMSRQQRQVAKSTRLNRAPSMVKGVELVPEVARLAAMNLLLHGIGGVRDDDVPIVCADSLKTPPASKVDVVLTNPPFGVRGSVTYTSGGRSSDSDDDLKIVRPDFWVETANKQLNFLQHVATLLKEGGRAAIIVPDNVLFESGVAATIRRRLLKDFRVHTLLRLPTGLFYAQGVQANVLFFNRLGKGDPVAMEKLLWVYDLRSGTKFSLKTRPLAPSDLEDFVRAYKSGNTGKRTEHSPDLVSGQRWRAFEIGQILATREASLNLSWRRVPSGEDNSSLARFAELSNALVSDLQRAMTEIRQAMSSPTDQD